MRLIDADALIKSLGIGDLPIRLTYEIESAPTVDAVPVRHGKWIDITESHIGTCSLCGDRWGSVDMMNYCPSCGARMVEDE